MTAVLTGVRWYVIVLLIWGSLIISVSVLSCAYQPSVCLLWRSVYLGLRPIFWLGCLLFCCMSCLYILEIKPLSVASFANIFSQSVGCLFSNKSICTSYFITQNIKKTQVSGFNKSNNFSASSKTFLSKTGFFSLTANAWQWNNSLMLLLILLKPSSFTHQCFCANQRKCQCSVKSK